MRSLTNTPSPRKNLPIPKTRVKVLQITMFGPAYCPSSSLGSHYRDLSQIASLSASLSRGSLSFNCDGSSLNSHPLLQHLWVKVASRSRRKMSYLCWCHAAENGLLKFPVSNSLSCNECTSNRLNLTPCCKRWFTISTWPPLTAYRMGYLPLIFVLVLRLCPIAACTTSLRP